jgi:hypothetical protein
MKRAIFQAIDDRALTNVDGRQSGGDASRP